MPSHPEENPKTAKPGVFPAAKQLFTLHGWLGLGLGFVLAIVCGSGAIAVFGHELDWLLNPALRVQPAAERASFDSIHAAIGDAYPNAKIGWWQIQAGKRFADEVIVYPAYRDLEDWGPETRVYVDPYRASIQGVAGYLTVRTFLRGFHYYWFDRTGWGFYVVSAFAFVLLGLTLTGMAIYKRWWRGLFALRFFRGRRIFFSDFHKLCGAWTLVFNLVICVTAFYYLVEWIGGGHDWEKQTPTLSAERVARIPRDARPLGVDAQVANARRHFPDLRIASISFPMQPGDPFYFDGQATGWLVRDRANKLLLDPYDGTPVHLHRAEDLGAGHRWVETVDSIHFGNFGGMVSKAIWCVLGLMIPALFLTGAWLGLRRAGASVFRELRNYRNPLNVLSLAATAALIAFATLSTAYSVRESLSEVPLQPRAMGKDSTTSNPK